MKNNIKNTISNVIKLEASRIGAEEDKRISQDALNQIVYKQHLETIYGCKDIKQTQNISEQLGKQFLAELGKDKKPILKKSAVKRLLRVALNPKVQTISKPCSSEAMLSMHLKDKKLTSQSKLVAFVTSEESKNPVKPIIASIKKLDEKHLQEFISWYNSSNGIKTLVEDISSVNVIKDTQEKIIYRDVKIN